MKKNKKAYVLQANEKYIDIVTMAAKSIREFSDLPIIVYMINCDLKINVSNTLTINWHCDIENEDKEMYLTEESSSNFYINRSNNKIFKLLIQRPNIIRDALLKYTELATYIDSDSVATPYIDRVFSLYPPTSTYPYFTEGIYDWMLVDGRGGAANREDLSTTLEHPACELFGADQQVRTLYRTSNIFVAGQNAIDWLEEWYWMCNHPKVLKNPKWYAAYHEETLANVLLWKNKQLKGLPCIYANGDDSVVDEVYTKLGFTGRTQSVRAWLKVPARKEDLLVFHGEKRLDVMEEMIKKIKSHVTKQENKKILFVSPHLSTGGLPQYLLKKVKFLMKDHDVYGIEYNCSSGDYVVQRNQMIELLGDRFYTLWENKREIFDIIEDVKPDVIHLEEIPEFFMEDSIAVEIYGRKDRDYFIVESTHSSQSNPNDLRFYPDKFIFVSKWSQQVFTKAIPYIPSEVWEYPIENYEKNKEKALSALDLDPNYKHVLMVGLFTPGKNQGEIFKVADKLKDYDVLFHFVGNQAPNFAEYWAPIMKNKPKNCVVWGERNDVDNFYQACDVFYFSSKLELNPLSIKEALSYDMPCLFRRLHTYTDTYDNNDLVTYIDEDLDSTVNALIKKLGYV